MKVSWDYYSQLNGKIIFTFQTTNQFHVFPLQPPPPALRPPSGGHQGTQLQG